MSDPNQKQSESNQGLPFEHEEGASKEEILGSILERTIHSMEDTSCHGVLTDYVSENRLPSKFSFENLCELVRCVLERTSIDQLPIETEECVTWVANCIYEDPVANERTEILWNSIVSRIQN
jgi:hypothetical protein